MSLALKKALVEKYGGFSDKRIKRLETGKTFIVDDRSGGDEGSAGLYSTFCMVFATVKGQDEVEVLLHGNVPASAEVKAWFATHGSLDNRSGTFVVKPESAGLLLELAKVLRRITAPGKTYSVPSYKYVVPRTAESLERLGAVLTSFAKSKGS